MLCLILSSFTEVFVTKSNGVAWRSNLLGKSGTSILHPGPNPHAGPTVSPKSHPFRRLRGVALGGPVTPLKVDMLNRDLVAGHCIIPLFSTNRHFLEVAYYILLTAKTVEILTQLIQTTETEYSTVCC